MDGTARQLDLREIQGLILRGYRLPRARHFVVTVQSAPAARAALCQLISGDAARCPQLTTAEGWENRPDHCLNLGITWPGLEALGWRDDRGDASRAFAAFREGPAARAGSLGDVGDSAPERWIGGLGSGRDHVLLVLYAADGATLDRRAADLERLLLAGGAFELALRFDAEALPGERVHFGYRDGISQPRIEGAPNVLEDGQPIVPAWHFVLRDDAITYRLPEPAELFRNGSFGILRILEQDVSGFEAMLEANRARIDPELLAAKLMGRWRNGVPLVLSPDGSESVPPIAPEELNRFDYLADRVGHQCPIGAHIRRTFPRSQVVAGGSTRNRRLVRRGLPYGPPFVPGQAVDGIARGLIGMFINAQIEDQYEFVIKQWMNLGGFTAHLPNDSRDFFASGDGSGREFEVPLGPAAAVRVRALSSFIKTRGSAYCLLPSRTGLAQLIR